MVDAFQTNIKKVNIKPENLPAIIVKPPISISGVSPSSPSAGSVTYTATNRLKVGDTIDIQGLSPSGYNGNFTVVSATQSAFVVTNSTTATVTDAVGEAHLLGQYYFRYKIVSENGSKRSAWTPVQVINARDFTSVSVNLNVVSDGEKFMLSWTSPDVYMTQYDLYVAWSSNSGSTYTAYSYSGRSTGNSFVIDIPVAYQSEDGTKMAKFAIQLPTSPQILNTPAQIFLSSTGVSTETSPIDGGVV